MTQLKMLLQVENCRFAPCGYNPAGAFMAKSELENREKSKLSDILSFSAFQDFVAGRKIGAHPIQNAFKTRKLLIGSLINVIQPLIMAETEFEYHKKSKLGTYMSSSAIRVPMEEKKTLLLA